MANLVPHITKEQLAAFHNNQLSQDETSKILEHIAHCTYCSDLFAESFQPYAIIKAPPGLKESILTKTKRKHNTISLIHWKTSKNRQMFFYSLKVCAAMCGALLIMFTSMRVDMEKNNYVTKERPTLNMGVLESLNSTMRDYYKTIDNETVNEAK